MPHGDFTTSAQRKEVASAGAYYNENEPLHPNIYVMHIILHDEGTGTEYRIEVSNKDMAVWSTVKEE